MMKIKKYQLISLSVVLLALAAITSIGCANRGNGPQGGPEDKTPPKIVKSTPENGAINHKKPSVEIEFDEIVVLNNAFEKVVVSPPQKEAAEVKALGKKIRVAFQDTLLENTTYTIGFSDAIADNNEGNKLENYSFSFSTGETIDTLEISGILLDAETLNPVGNALVGVHSDLADSAFTTKRFDRIAKTSTNGRFSIKNIKQGSYKLYALNDLSGDFLFDQSEEAIAFLDTVFTPSAESRTLSDTIWKDSVTVDSITTRVETAFLPDSVILHYFKEESQQQYFLRAERKLPYKFSLAFNAPLDTLPIIQPLNFSWNDTILLQISEKRDTLTYWTKDSCITKLDTLNFELFYPKTDSLGVLVNAMDTINLPLRRAKNGSQTTRRRKNNEPEPTTFLAMKSNLSGKFDVYKNVELTFDEPITFVSDTAVSLEKKRDTLWIEQTFALEKADSMGMKFAITQKWDEGATYRLKIDSAAIVANFSGLHTDKYESEFTLKTKEDYATLMLTIEPHTGKEVLELLNESEKVVRAQTAENATVTFQHLDAGKYYLRLFVDENGDQKWTTGNYKKKLQPEKIYYYTKQLELRAYWDFDETWDYTETPILQQKPKEIVKPIDAKAKKN